MSDYIKREDAIKEANTWSMFGNDNLESRLKRLPPADVAEVRHGHWIDVGADLDGACYYRCSVCGSDAVDGYEYPLCPYCGAKMDGEEQENE